MTNYNGLNSSLGNLPRLSLAKTRSISPESFTGEKGNRVYRPSHEALLPNVPPENVVVMAEAARE